MNKQQYDEFNALAKSHYEQDMLVKGSYGVMADKFTGCSVGCLAQDALLSKKMKRGEEIDSSSIHKKLADHFDYPEWLCRLQDNLFENTDMTFHVEFAAAMPVDFDNWQSLMHRIHARILREIALPPAGDSSERVLAVIGLHESESEDCAAWAEAAAEVEAAAAEAAWKEETGAWEEERAAAAAAESAWAAEAAEATWLTAAVATAAWVAPERQTAAWSRICGIVLTEMRACK